MSAGYRIAMIALIMVLPVHADEAATQQRIDEAVLALPEHLRAGASVAYFDDGERVVLREGDNGLICQPDDPDTPGFAAWCYPKSHDAYARRWYELAAAGHDRETVDAMIASEIESRVLEWPKVAVNYNLRGGSLDTAVPLTVVYVPFATGAEIGVTETRQFNRPWLMLAGTAFAHIMIPGQ